MLVRKRTAELQNALAERDRLEEAERAARLRLGELERMGAISQLCAMIAHELKQPVTSIINYVTVIKLRAGMVGGAAAPPASGTPGKPPAAPAPSADPVFEKAVDGVEAASKRIAGIVDRCGSTRSANGANPWWWTSARRSKPPHPPRRRARLRCGSHSGQARPTCRAIRSNSSSSFSTSSRTRSKPRRARWNATPSRTPEVVVALACGGDARRASSAAHDVRASP